MPAQRMKLVGGKWVPYQDSSGARSADKKKGNPWGGRILIAVILLGGGYAGGRYVTSPVGKETQVNTTKDEVFVMIKDLDPKIEALKANAKLEAADLVRDHKSNALFLLEKGKTEEAKTEAMKGILLAQQTLPGISSMTGGAKREASGSSVASASSTTATSPGTGGGGGGMLGEQLTVIDMQSTLNAAHVNPNLSGVRTKARQAVEAANKQAQASNSSEY